MKLFTASAIISLVLTVAARGAVVVDQQYSFASSFANSTNGDVTQIGQTFTVGMAGMLDHVDVFMFRLGGIFETTGDPLLRIYNTSGGFPTGSPLASVSIPETNVPYDNAAFVSFNVSSAAIAVNVSDVLAFSVIATAGVGPYFLPTDQGQLSGYAGGAAVLSYGGPWQAIAPSQDHSFKTYVNAATGPTADFDDDSDVDGADFLTWQRNLTTPSPTLAQGNANGDSVVDGADLAIWEGQYGTSVAAATPVPEPSTAVLVMVGCGLMAWWSNRCK